MPNKDVDTEALKEDIKASGDIAVIAKMKGGVAVRTALVKDIAVSLDKMLANRATLTHTEFVACASDMKSKLDVLKLLTRAEANKQGLIKLLEEIVQ